MKRILITGAASGIGKESARRFAREGWRVGLVDRERPGLDALAGELGEGASVHVADVTDEGAMQAALRDFCGAEGALDALFNCAGILEMALFAATPTARLRRIVDVNVNGVINGIHAALPYLRRADGSTIVTMGSVAGIYGVPEEAVYSASKFAVRGLTEALNIELEADGIWVCDVMVAYVATPMVNDAAHKAKSVGILGVNVTADQVADTVWSATRERRVHWFVTEADAAVAAQVDQTPWEERAAIMRGIAGF